MLSLQREQGTDGRAAGNRWKLLRTQVQPKFHVSNSQNTHLRGHQHANTWWMQIRAATPLPANQSSTKLDRRAHGVNLSRRIITPFKVSRLKLLKIMHGNGLLSKSKFCFEAFSNYLINQQMTEQSQNQGWKPLFETTTVFDSNGTASKRNILQNCGMMSKGARRYVPSIHLFDLLVSKALKAGCDLLGCALPKKLLWTVVSEETEEIQVKNNCLTDVFPEGIHTKRNEKINGGGNSKNVENNLPSVPPKTSHVNGFMS